MLVHVIVELYILPPEAPNRGRVPSAQPSKPSRSDTLKAVFNAELEEVGGFQNWRENIVECNIAERMLADSGSSFESIDRENSYVLEGYFEGNFSHVFINWEYGKQPFIRKVEHEDFWRRVK